MSFGYRVLGFGTVASAAAAPYNVDFLVIAGGAGGGHASYGGGGGAGGYRNSYSSETSGGGGSSESAVTVTPGTQYTVTCLLYTSPSPRDSA